MSYIGVTDAGRLWFGNNSEKYFIVYELQHNDLPYADVLRQGQFLTLTHDPNGFKSKDLRTFTNVYPTARTTLAA